MWNGKVIFFLSFATIACLFATSAPVPSWRKYLTLLIAFLLLSIYLSLQSTMNANNLPGATADDSGGYDVPSPFTEILQSLYIHSPTSRSANRNSAASWIYRRSFA
tara:strand:+ start:28288 stop:28605 length:318 start_codon:yes stop_codon:yes gene_type:complete